MNDFERNLARRREELSKTANTRRKEYELRKSYQANEVQKMVDFWAEGVEIEAVLGRQSKIALDFLALMKDHDMPGSEELHFTCAYSWDQNPQEVANLARTMYGKKPGDFLLRILGISPQRQRKSKTKGYPIGCNQPFLPRYNKDEIPLSHWGNITVYLCEDERIRGLNPNSLDFTSGVFYDKMTQYHERGHAIGSSKFFKREPTHKVLEDIALRVSPK